MIDLILLALENHIGPSTNDPDGNRTRVTAVKGRCLNRLTTGPKCAHKEKRSLSDEYYLTIPRDILQALFCVLLFCSAYFVLLFFAPVIKSCYLLLQFIDPVDRERKRFLPTTFLH